MRGAGMVRRVLDALYLGAGIAAGGFLVAIFVLMMVMSAGRQLGVNVPSGDDFASWFMAAMAFLGLAHTFRSGDMIRVGLLVERVRGPARWWMEMTALVLGFRFAAYFAWHAVVMTWQSWQFNDTSQGVVVVPLWIPQLGYAGGLVILAVAMLDELVHVGLGGTPRYEKPPAATAEEVVERAIQGGV